MTSEEAGVHPNSDDMKGGYVNLVLTRGKEFKGSNTEDTGFPII